MITSCGLAISDKLFIWLYNPNSSPSSPPDKTVLELGFQVEHAPCGPLSRLGTSIIGGKSIYLFVTTINSVIKKKQQEVLKGKQGVDVGQKKVIRQKYCTSYQLV